MNSNYNTIQPNFTANVVANGIKLDSKKLEAVQKRFSQLTQHYKEDTLTISAKMINGKKIGGDVGQVFHVADFNTAQDNPASIIYFKDFKKWFEMGSVEEIAKSLTRIFKSGKFNEVQEPKLIQMKKNLMHVQNAAEINSKKAEISQNPIYSVLAANNKARGESLRKEIVNTQDYTYDILNKIQDYPIDAPIFWWHG